MDISETTLLLAEIVLQELIEENHAHLVAMGVSHPSLEAIKAKTKFSPYGLSTKLTGAGGGGCAVTLVPDGKHQFPQHTQSTYSGTDFKETALQDLVAALTDDHFDPYLTSVGGSGLGILSPYGQRPLLAPSPVTPPGTPDGRGKPVTLAAGAPPEPLRSPFETTDMGELAGWADGLGRWLFV